MSYPLVVFFLRAPLNFAKYTNRCSHFRFLHNFHDEKVKLGVLLIFYFITLAWSKTGMDHLVSMDAKDNTLKLILIVVFHYMNPGTCLYINEHLFILQNLIEMNPFFFIRHFKKKCIGFLW